MSLIIKDKEKVWLDILEMITSKSIISTTRGNASAKLKRILGYSILLEFQHQGKVKEVIIKKSDFSQAIDVLSEKGKVRQSDLSNPDKRYVLGAMKELPYYFGVF
jgi:hypothetical protein